MSTTAQEHSRIGVRLRVLAAMVLAMTLFLLALLFIIYHQVAALNTPDNAKSVVVSLIPLVLAILIVCGALFFMLTNRFVLRPIKRIRDAALAISKGALDTAITPSGNDEIGDLAASVAQMASALKRDIESLKEVDTLKSEFISISSHNLRTPLASIEGGLDVLESASLTDQQQKMLNIIRSSASNLITFSEDMLTIANIEAREGSTAPETTTTVQEILKPLLTDGMAAAEKQQITFTTTIGDAETTIQANPQLLRLAFRNILDNAFKFTKTGTVSVVTRIENAAMIVQIADSGIGISKDEIPHLFTKFHRGTDTLVYNYEGAGVGLYIAKLILDQHHASITIDSTPDKGTTVTVKLPLTLPKLAGVR